MLSREDALQVLETVYRARCAGDKEGLASQMGAGAQFRLVGDQSRMGGVPLASDSAMKTIGELVDRFAFLEHAILDGVFEGNKLAARVRVTCEVPGRPAETTEVLDLVEFGADGKISDFVQFADTALIRDMAS